MHAFSIRKYLLFSATLLLLIALTGLAYAQIIFIPFYLDDFSSIIQNPVVQLPVDFYQVWTHYKARFITYSAFALQLEFFGNDSTSFHLVGLGLHILVGAGIFWFVSLTNLPRILAQKSIIAIIPTTVFLLHPQNTQAVIYIAQQAVLWTSLFCMASLCCYMHWRKSKSNQPAKIIWLGFSILAACCALFSKQTAASLPLAILMIEWLFFGAYTRRLILMGIGCLLLSFVYLAFIQNWQWNTLFFYIDSISRETTDIARLDYFANQTVILWHYIAQYFSLSGFRLEYDFKIAESWQIIHWVALFAHVAVLILSVLLKRVSPMITFGVLFYYLTHLIESTFFPIRDIVFEHRAYLPNVGMSVAIIALVLLLFEMLSLQLSKVPILFKKAVALTLCAVILLVLTQATQNRVGQWADPLVFYKNEITLSPKSPRATGAYANGLADSGNCPLAIGYYNHATALYELKHKSALGIQPEMLINYIRCLRTLKVYNKAEKWELFLLEQVFEPIRRSMILGQRGQFYLEQKDFETANKALTEALSLNDKDYAIVMNLAISRVNLGQTEVGRALLNDTLVLKPGDKMAIHLLGLLNSKK